VKTTGKITHFSLKIKQKMQKNNKKVKKIELERYNFRVCHRLMPVSTAIFGLLITGRFAFWANLCFEWPICCKKVAFCDFGVPYGQFYQASK
jgi:hypothetical protein